MHESGDNGTESFECMGQYLLHHSPMVYVLILKNFKRSNLVPKSRLWDKV